MSNSTDTNIPADPNAVSRIAAGMTVKEGEVISTNDIRVDGRYEGKITSKGRLIVGEGGYVNADVICNNLDVWGTFEGTAAIKDTLSLRKGSKVSGGFSAGHLVVELGSNFDGSMHVITDEEFRQLAGDTEIPDEPQPRKKK